MNDDATTTVRSPLYLVKSFEPCWKCHKEQSVIAIATRHIRTEDFDFLDAGDQGPVFLMNIEAMPQPILEYLSAAFPQFQNRRSHTMEMDYYANTCKDCGANFGDFYLFNVGHAFSPMDAEQAKRMSIVELPYSGTFEFQCSWSMGSAGDLIFRHAAGSESLPEAPPLKRTAKAKGRGKKPADP